MLAHLYITICKQHLQATALASLAALMSSAMTRKVHRGPQEKKRKHEATSMKACYAIYCRQKIAIKHSHDSRTSTDMIQNLLKQISNMYMKELDALSSF